MDIKWEVTINDPVRSRIREDHSMFNSTDKPKWGVLEDFISKNDYKIIGMRMIVDGKEIELPECMDDYYQGTHASADLQSGKVTVLTRYIGYTNGNINVRVDVDAITGNISLGDSQ